AAALQPHGSLLHEPAARRERRRSGARPVKLAIQKHMRDFVALFFMGLVALGVTSYILTQERFHLPKWVPAIGSDFYKLNVELQTGQAVVPGQGQTVDIAGVKVGDVSSVRLKNGVAVVQVNMEKKYAP